MTRILDQLITRGRPDMRDQRQNTGEPTGCGCGFDEDVTL